jgi:hypothetical protein
VPGLPFEQIWFFDFEFSAPDGERPVVRCLVAMEYFSRQKTRIWLDGQQSAPVPPFRLDASVLLVGYFATADLNCFLALGWPLPARLVDLYVEFKRQICGRDGEPDKPSLVYALDWFGLDSRLHGGDVFFELHPRRLQRRTRFRRRRHLRDKNSRSGAILWAAGLGGFHVDGVAVDGTGTNVYFVGEYVVGPYDAHGFAAQLNAATGAVNGSRTVSGTRADAVAADGSGFAYVTSQIASGGTGTRYVTKLDGGGIRQWQDTITSGGSLGERSVTVLGSTVYVGATIYNIATFSVGSSTHTFGPSKPGKTSGQADYVLKLGSDNTYGWVRTFQGASNSYILTNRVAADVSGNVYAFGEFLGTVSFGSTTPNAGSKSDSDFVAS